ncbi:hypothetical protein V7127_01270 [Bacillus sp. JJ1773]|uniref:hypothetical protein n=1 Tax=Bacillus sp. JJ1773 TaxID=3122965 RepID=UPI003000ED0B
MVDRVNIQAFIYTRTPRTTFLLLKRTLEKSGFWQPVSGGLEKDEQPTLFCKKERAYFYYRAILWSNAIKEN